MGINVECPNGHALNVKDKYAGKRGFCPVCNARIQVPERRPTVSEDDVLAILGASAQPAAAPAGPSEYVFEDPPHSARTDGSGLSLLGSSMIRRKKICVHCGHLASFTFTLCPKCGAALGAPSDASPPTKPK